MNLFDLFVTIGLKDEVSNKVPGIGDKLKSGLATAGKVAAVGVAAATTAAIGGIAALTKSSVAAYGEFEQLVGGVETLFGAGGQSLWEYAESVGKAPLEAAKAYNNLVNAQNAVMKNADEAYKTAGMSANQYMETVTSFSAALIQSLDGDTAKAAELADKAIIDMSDNANKMGSDIQSIQNAYQGFAKQNYTMLDNLKLGYGGTKEEMQRLLTDAQAISGIEYDISSYADVVEAIHVIQTEMGITGTTAKEAGSTIQGSVASMKAAWQNLTVGFADENANIDQLMDNFLASVGTVASNVFPVVERILSNIFQTMKDNGPEMLDKAIELFGQIAMGALRAIPNIIGMIPEIVSAIARGFKDAWPEIVQIGKDIVLGLWEGIKSLAGWLGDQVTGFFDGLFDKVEENEEIHSPSKKWAEIGKYDALGFASGWNSQFGSIQRGITDSLDFGTASVGFAESGLGVASAGIINASGGARGYGLGGSFELILKSDDGQQFGRWMVPYVRSENRSNPEVVSDAL